LNPAAAGLFDLCYLPSPGTEMIPTGWSSVDEDKTYPLLSSRLPRVVHDENDDEEGEESSPGNFQRESSESSEDEDTLRNSGGVSTRMVEESDEDEDDLPPPIQQRVSKVLFLPPPSSPALVLKENVSNGNLFSLDYPCVNWPVSD
jgi:ubiquitin carboxyl-terminal hydrolase 4/11/15